MLTPQKASEKLRTFYRNNNRMPSIAEVCKLFNYASKGAAHYFIKKLIDEGYTDKDRSGRLIATSKLTLPLLGFVQAGFPSPAEEELIDTLSLDDYLIRNPDQSFLLKVTGDSMKEAAIDPGDLVIIEKGRTPKNGDIVLAQIDREWTLKYFFKEGKKVFLRAANKKYKDIYPNEELTIGGVVKAVIRRYS